MGTIVKNEFYKIFRQKKLYVFIVLTLLLQGAATYISVREGIGVEAPDFFNILLSAVNTFVIIFGILFVSQTVTEDMKAGTIKMSVIQPLNRASVILGKMLFIALTVLLMYSIAYVSGLIFASIGMGFVGMTAMLSVFKATMLTVLVINSFLSLVTFLGLVFNIPTLVTTLGIVISVFASGAVTMMVFLKVLPPDAQYFFVTEYYTLFFSSLPAVSGFWWRAAVAISAPIAVFVPLNVYLFKKKEIHF